MQHEITNASGELGTLTDSLSSVVRWRYSDYESFLRTQLTILAEHQSSIDDESVGDGAASLASRLARPGPRVRTFDGILRQ